MLLPPKDRKMKKYWFVFCKSDLVLVKHDDGTFSVPLSEYPPIAVKPWTTVHHITIPDALASGFEDYAFSEVGAFSIAAPIGDDGAAESASEQEEKLVMCPLRQSFYKLTNAHYLMAGKCYELLYWDSNTKYCGVCGSPMKMHSEISKRCTQCGKEIWPQLATAVIVLIHRGDEVLLVRARNFRGDFYGLVAGFVETGETLEEAVEREVHEETGLQITNIRYFASQPWPYPSGLMVGFHADYVSGEIHLQHSELSSGGWFTKDNLPHIPEKLSIARRLLDSWIDE